jgi:hypothetical protein
MNSSDGDCGEERNVVLKAAQLGASEIALQWIEKCKDSNRVVEILDQAVSEAYGTSHSAAAAAAVSGGSRFKRFPCRSSQSTP